MGATAVADPFESAAAHVTTEFAGDTPDAGAPAPEKKRGRGRPPKHGRYSKNRNRGASDAAPAAEPGPPEIQAPIFDREQLGHAVDGFLTAIADASQTRGPHPAESRAIGESLAFGLENSAIGLEKAGPWTPLIIAVSMYALPRAIEAAQKYAERKRADREVSAAGDFRAVAEAVSPAPSTDTVLSENPEPDNGRVRAVGVSARRR